MKILKRSESLPIPAEARDTSSSPAGRMRRVLQQMHEVDGTEISGVWRVPCRFCWGLNNQWHYTRAEMAYLNRAYMCGCDAWPQNVVTSEFGLELHTHALAAYHAGRRHFPMDLKGGEGYTRDGEPNPHCPQCSGLGVEMFWIADTRKLPRAARRLFESAEVTPQGGIKVHLANRQPIRDILCRDLKIGTERKEVAVVPAQPSDLTDEELRTAINRMDAIELSEEEYEEVPVEPNLRFRRRIPLPT